MRIFSNSLSALAFAVLWPVALLVIAIFCAWLERRTLLPPEAARRARQPTSVARTVRRQAPTTETAAAPAAPAPTRPAGDQADGVGRPQRAAQAATTAPVPPLQPAPSEGQSFSPSEGQSFTDPSAALGRYRPLGRGRVPRDRAAVPSEQAATRPQQRP